MINHKHILAEHKQMRSQSFYMYVKLEISLSDMFWGLNLQLQETTANKLNED